MTGTPPQCSLPCVGPLAGPVLSTATWGDLLERGASGERWVLGPEPLSGLLPAQMTWTWTSSSWTRRTQSRTTVSSAALSQVRRWLRGGMGMQVPPGVFVAELRARPLPQSHLCGEDSPPGGPWGRQWGSFPRRPLRGGSAGGGDGAKAPLASASQRPYLRERQLPCWGQNGAGTVRSPLCSRPGVGRLRRLPQSETPRTWGAGSLEGRCPPVSAPCPPGDSRAGPAFPLGS